MILIIDNYDSFTYNLYQGIAAFHRDVRVLRNDTLTLSDLQTIKPDGIVLSPGPGRPEGAGICVELIRGYIKGDVDSSIPLLGVCLGHQAIVAALGGAIIEADEIVHGKEDIIFHSKSGLYQSLPQPFKSGRYHSLIADHSCLPASLIIDAYNSNQVIMGVHHRSLPLYGVQFHPESILTPDGHLILKAFALNCTNTSVSHLHGVGGTL